MLFVYIMPGQLSRITRQTLSPLFLGCAWYFFGSMKLYFIRILNFCGFISELLINDFFRMEDGVVMELKQTKIIKVGVIYNEPLSK